MCCSPTCSLMLVLLSAPFLTTGTRLTSQTHCSLYERNVNWMMSWQIPCSRRTGLHSKTLSGKGFGVFLSGSELIFRIKAERELLGVSLHKFSVQNRGLSLLCCWEHHVSHGFQVAPGTGRVVGLPTLPGARLHLISLVILAALRIFPGDTELAFSTMTRSSMWMRPLGKKKSVCCQMDAELITKFTLDRCVGCTLVTAFHNYLTWV